MEATYTDNRFIAIIAAVLFLLFTLLLFTHNFTATSTIPQVEVLQWSADTCWGKW